MSNHCLHGFRTAECASCRTCEHGLVTSRCGQCNAPSRVRAARSSRASRAAQAAQTPDSIAYAGFEIFYVPDVSGWRFRATPDAVPSALSYRSAFLARKAIDEGEGAQPARGGKAASR
jgi:hypothetical protein